MAHATKPDRPTVGALQERLTELEQENDELRRALWPFDPQCELRRLAEQLEVLQLLGQTLLDNAGEMAKHLAEIQEGVARAEADR